MVRNLVVYPSANVTASHGGYNAIADARGQYDTTYVSHSLSTSNSSRTSTYRCNAKSTEQPVGDKIIIRSITGGQTYTRLTSNNAASQTASLVLAASIGGRNFTNATPALQVNTNQNNFVSTSYTISNLNGTTQSYSNISDANIQVRITTAGSYTTDSKNNSAEMRISAVNLDVTYENVFTCRTVAQGNGIASAVPSSQEVIEGNTCSFAATLEPNCRFIGWYQNAEFTGNPFSTSQSFSRTITSSLTLYPKGEVPNRVYIFSDSSETDKFTYTLNKSIAFTGDQVTLTITSIEEPYLFAGVFEADSEGHKLSNSLSNSTTYTFTMPNQDVYLFVDLGKGVKIYVDCQNCSLVGATSPIQSAVGKSETLTFAFDSSSYDWAGIYSDARYQNRLTREQVYSFMMENNDVYLYAKAIAKQQIYVKGTTGWEAYSKVYVKENGTWVEKEDLTSIFSTTKNYKRIAL